MPGAAHHGDVAEAFATTLTDCLAHERFTTRLARGRRRQCLANGRHSFAHRAKDVGVVGALLDETLPPALRVALAGGLGECPDRIAALV
jgi:hypothetical protein